MFEQIREWITGHQRESFLIGLALIGAIALVLASGFQVEVGQFFAFQCTDDSECSSEQYCSSGGRCIGGTNPNQTECTLVTGPSWTGGTNACKKEADGPGVPPVPENFLPHVTLQNRGGLPGIATSAPYGSQEGYTCFEFTVPAGNAWGAFDATSGGTVPAPPGQQTLTGQYFNNCPWQVEMTGGAAGSPKAGNDFIFKTDGTIDEPIAGLDQRITRGTTELIPSCWNYPHVLGTNTNPGGGSGGGGGSEGPGNIYDWKSAPVYRISEMLGDFFGVRALAQQAGCSGTYTITLDLGGFDAGRVEASLGWKHHDQVGTAPGSTTIQDGYNVVANTGRDCTQSPGELCAGAGAGSGVGGGGGGTSGTSGPGPGGSFNCGTGEGSDGCWCGEWGDAVWAQRHANAGSQCVPGYQLTAEYKQFLVEVVPSFHQGDGAPDGTTDGDIQDWSRSEVQAFIDIMSENFTDTGGKNCVPRGGTGSVDYAGIQEKYFAIGATGIGLSGNGSSAVAYTCRNDVGVEPAELTATCQAGPAVRLEWNIPLGAVANGIIRRLDGEDGQFLTDIGRLQTNFTDSDLESGNTYSYQHKAHASVESNIVEVVIEDDGTCLIAGGSSVPPVSTNTPPPGTSTSTPAPGATCGDGVCVSGESCSSCSADCGTCSSTCGDGSCGFGESASNCADDCGSPGARCGDSVCDSHESCSSCSNDCGTCGSTGGSTGGQVGAAGQTPTGPGAATLLAFMLASVTALLYVSYTHTSLFRRREVQKVTGDDHMDFRA